MGVPLDPQVLYCEVSLNPLVVYIRGVVSSSSTELYATLGSSNTIIGGYFWVLIYYISGTPLDSQTLHIEGIVRSSGTVLSGNPYDLMHCIMEIALHPQVLYYGGIFVSSSTILWPHP
jgi:hypothetical protein